jgi:hypothetical protein
LSFTFPSFCSSEYSCLLSPHILSTLFSNTLDLCSFFRVRDKVSYPYKITQNILIFTFRYITTKIYYYIM